MLLNTVDTRLKLSHMWPLPRRFGINCTYTFLQLKKSMIYVHVLVAIWMHSYYRMFGQIAGAVSAWCSIGCFLVAGRGERVCDCDAQTTGRSGNLSCFEHVCRQLEHVCDLM
jgi:hypothetical protein